MDLKEFFGLHPRVAVAFSGGVDSSYLLYAAKECGAKVCAYYVKSAFQPQFELDDAKRLADELGTEMKVLSADILADETVTANPPDRCYYCKQRVFSEIIAAAKADGYTVIVDGTNASDDEGDRPGMAALRELSVLSPLRECGLTKSRIRELSKEAGLFTWDKPAYACLATRIKTGQTIDERLLQRTEKAEGYLFSLGFSDFRVRTVGETAKIQLREEQIPLFDAHRSEIEKKLLEDYGTVILDTEVRR